MLAERLKERRQALSMSQTDVCRKSGIAKPTVSQIENGWTQNPHYATLRKLAGALDTTVDFLLGTELSVDEQSCQSCRYFQRSQNENNPNLGLCRRYPPFASGKEYVIVNINKWCGEWKNN